MSAVVLSAGARGEATGWAGQRSWDETVLASTVGVRDALARSLTGDRCARNSAGLAPNRVTRVATSSRVAAGQMCAAALLQRAPAKTALSTRRHTEWEREWPPQSGRTQPLNGQMELCCLPGRDVSCRCQHGHAAHCRRAGFSAGLCALLAGHAKAHALRKAGIVPRPSRLVLLLLRHDTLSH